MTNQPTDPREAALRKEKSFQDWKGLSPKANTRTYWERRQEKAFGAGYDVGFRDGAASVDRVQIVRAAFGELQLEIKDERWIEVLRAMDAVIAAMEKGK